MPSCSQGGTGGDLIPKRCKGWWGNDGSRKGNGGRGKGEGEVGYTLRYSVTTGTVLVRPFGLAVRAGLLSRRTSVLKCSFGLAVNWSNFTSVFTFGLVVRLQAFIETDRGPFGLAVRR